MSINLHNMYINQEYVHKSVAENNKRDDLLYFYHTSLYRKFTRLRYKCPILATIGGMRLIPNKLNSTKYQ